MRDPAVRTGEGQYSCPALVLLPGPGALPPEPPPCRSPPLHGPSISACQDSPGMPLVQISWPQLSTRCSTWKPNRHFPAARPPPPRRPLPSSTPSMLMATAPLWLLTQTRNCRVILVPSFPTSHVQSFRTFCPIGSNFPPWHCTSSQKGPWPLPWLPFILYTWMTLQLGADYFTALLKTLQ